MTGWRRPIVGPQGRDLAVGVLAAVAIVVGTHRMDAAGGDRPLDVGADAAMAVAGLALAGRHRSPVVVTAVVTAATAVYLGRGYPGGPVFLTLFAALYALAARGSRRDAFGAAAAATAVLVLVGEVAHTGPGLAHLVFVGWAAAAVFLGDAVRSHRAYLAELEARAASLERSREEEARRRVSEERLRIAQDLHDSVAHSMATINVQAGVAAHVIGRHPERAGEALAVIQQASGEVLDELGALLGLLRVDGGAGPGLAPTPGPAQLGALVDSAGRSGLDVSLRVERDVGDLPQPVGVALYRIVQESLTNVARHAGPGATAAVTVAGDAGGGLSVEVVDDGGTGGGDDRVARARGAPVPGVARGSGTSGGTGVGIVGMHERAHATGGLVEVGARPQGGFAVRAVWPGRR